MRSFSVRSLLVAALGLAIIPLHAAVAQGGGPGGGAPMMERQKALVERVTKELNLSGDKADQVSKILIAEVTKRQEKMQALRESGGFDREAMMALNQELTTGTEKELVTVLSEAELGKYKEVRAAWQSEQRGRRRPNPGR